MDNNEFEELNKAIEELKTAFFESIFVTKICIPILDFLDKILSKGDNHGNSKKSR